MAILSNVNGKFAVDSTGAIQFSGQTGTSGYVLKSNGNAAPTWVDGSTVIGGPYLPLAGGILTGATSTASGISFTVGGTLTVNGGNIDIGPDALDIQIKAASNNSGNNLIYMRGNASNDKSSLQMNHFGYADYYIGVGHVGNGKFNISNSLTGDDFVIDTSGNVGIGGTLANKKLYVLGDTTNYQILAEQPSGYAGLSIKSTTVAQTWSWLANDNGSNSDLLLYGGSSAGTKLTIDSSGIVKINTTAVNARFRVDEGRTSEWVAGFKHTGTNPYGVFIDTSVNTSTGYTLGCYTNTGTGLFLKNDGNVGIGIATPTLVAGKIVHIHGVAAGVHLTDTASGTASGDGGYVAFDNPNLYIQNKEAGSMFFETSGTTRLTIDSSGNVIIGNTAVDNPNSLSKVLEIENGGSVGVILNDSRDAPMGLENRGAVFHLTYNTNSRLVVNGASGNIQIPTNSAKIQLRSSGSTDYSSIYRDASNVIQIANTAGTNIFSIDNGGNVGIGTTSPNSYSNQTVLTINGSSIGRLDLESGGTLRSYLFSQAANTTLSVDSGFFTIDVNSAERMRITSGGQIEFAATYNNTTASAANMHISSAGGQIFRSTSSLKYKTDVRDYDKGLNEVMQLQPKYYKGKDDGDTQFAGLIAEDVNDLGLSEFVQYAEDGTPDALAYTHMVALLVKSIQELEARIKILENK